MEYTIILISLITISIILKNIFGVNIKKIKELSKPNKLDELTQKLPEDEEVCMQILKLVNNENVKIQKSIDEKNQTSLYVVASNSIIIGNLQKSHARVQTLAHECLHSIQSKKMLMFNFMYSNLYILYFIIISILTLCNVIQNKTLQLFILTILGFIFFAVRSYLETSAMTKAKYLAKTYLEQTNLYTNQEIEQLTNSYEEINNVGIPFTNYSLVMNVIVKLVIYTVICLIKLI